jgi:hypothetical protein
MRASDTAPASFMEAKADMIMPFKGITLELA